MAARYYYLATLLSLSNFLQIRAADPSQGQDILFKEVDEIVRLRGYQATEHFITTEDGYILSLVRCRNPLLESREDKEIILFIHGTLTSSNCWVAYSMNARPKDHTSRCNLTSLSEEEEINRCVEDDPAKHSLPMLAMNFGHEVWFLNRRGTSRSRRRVNNRNPKVEKVHGGSAHVESLVTSALIQLTSPLSFNPVAVVGDFLVRMVENISELINGDYWAYSLDEQADYDVPASIDYILRETKRDKLAIVAHSTGGVVMLMSLASKPEISNNISQAILYSPAANLGHSLEEMAKFILGPILGPYIGPLPPLAAEPVIEASLAGLCARIIFQNPICRLGADFLFGRGGPNFNIFSGLITAFPKSVAARELAHLSQSYTQKSTRRFNFASKKENLEHYGQEVPPEYNFGAINLRKLTLITGHEDGLVSPKDVKTIVSQLSFEPKVRFLADGDQWNHGSYFANTNASKIVFVPTLIQLA